MWVLSWTKRHWGRFYPSTSVPPANHSTNFSMIIITRGWHNKPIGGRSDEWTWDSTPRYTNLNLNVSTKFSKRMDRKTQRTTQARLIHKEHFWKYLLRKSQKWKMKNGKSFFSLNVKCQPVWSVGVMIVDRTKSYPRAMLSTTRPTITTLALVPLHNTLLMDIDTDGKTVWSYWITWPTLYFSSPNSRFEHSSLTEF
jgi:hypothetical protein